jgi:hypothetical protein
MMCGDPDMRLARQESLRFLGMYLPRVGVHSLLTWAKPPNRVS